MLSVRCDGCHWKACQAWVVLRCRGDVAASFTAPPFIEAGIKPTPETHFQVYLAFPDRLTSSRIVRRTCRTCYNVVAGLV